MGNVHPTIPDPSTLLHPDFFARDAAAVARSLLGCELTTIVDGQVTSGRIVETEAYTGPEDPAAHGFGGRRTERNSSMFERGGTTYVYFIYGMYWCFNTVTGDEGFPSAVLIRALEPTAGKDIMARRRGSEKVKSLCSGPAKLCQALAIDGLLDGRLLPDTRVHISLGETPPDVAVSPRIGISKARDRLLRFCESGSPWASR